MRHEEGFFHSTDGLKIFMQTWYADSPKAAVLLIHGYGDHSGRYVPLAEMLTDNGVTVYALDCRGHGKSGGRRGAVTRFDQYLDDLEHLEKRIEESEQGRPWFILGHSQGGLIALKAAIERPGTASGVIASSPFLRLSIEVPAIKAVAGRLMSLVMPFVSLPTEIRPEDLSHDESVVDAYERDPLVHKVANARWFTEVEAAQKETMSSAQKLSLPLLLMQAGDDKLVSASASRKFFEAAGVNDKTYKEYPGLYHELLNESEPDRKRVFQDLWEWLSNRIPSA